MNYELLFNSCVLFICFALPLNIYLRMNSDKKSDDSKLIVFAFILAFLYYETKKKFTKK